MKPAADREDILSHLAESQEDLKRRYSLERIAVIGSMARGDYGDDSDVDLIVRFKPGTQHIHDLKRDLRDELEGVFRRPVQIASEKYLKSYYRSQVLKEAVYV